MSYRSTVLGTPGLVAFWPFDERGGINITTGTSVNLSGGDISLPNLSLGAGCTLMFWVYPTSIAFDNRFFSGTSHSAMRFATSGALQWLDTGGGWNTICRDYTMPNVNQWYHVAIVIDSGNHLALYLNGRRIYYNAADGVTYTPLNEAIKFGAKFAGSFGNSFAGNFCKIAYFPTALSRAQIFSILTGGASNYDANVLALSPSGYWKLDDTSGTSVTDYSGNGHTGTYEGSFTLGDTNMPGLYSRASDIFGTNHGAYIDSLSRGVTNNPAPQITDKVVRLTTATYSTGPIPANTVHLPAVGISARPCTWIGWVYPRDINTADMRILSPSEVGGSDDRLSLSSNQPGGHAGDLYAINNAGSWIDAFASTLTLNTWSFLAAAVTSGGTLKPYLNGSPLSVPSGTYNNAFDLDFFLGSPVQDEHTLTNPFGVANSADFSNLAVFNTELSAAQILAIWNASQTVPPTGPIILACA